jgi:hypothetical protein
MCTHNTHVIQIQKRTWHATRPEMTVDQTGGVEKKKRNVGGGAKREMFDVRERSCDSTS